MSVAAASHRDYPGDNRPYHDATEYHTISPSALANALIPQSWRRALEDARSTLQSDRKSRHAFDRMIKGAISYGTGRTPTLPDLNASELTATPELRALRDVTGTIMQRARVMSQAGWYSDEQLQGTAAELNEEWGRTMSELEHDWVARTEQMGTEDSKSSERATGILGSARAEDATDNDAETSTAVTTVPSEGNSSTSPVTESTSDQKWPKARAPKSKRPERPDSDSSPSDTSSPSPLERTAKSVASVLNGLANFYGAASSLATSTQRPVFQCPASSPPTSFTRHRAPRREYRVSLVPSMIPTRTVTTTTTTTTRRPLFVPSVCAY